MDKLLWIKITKIEDMPQKKTTSYEQYDCMVWVNGEPYHCVWNCEHLCWDDSHGDDYKYDWNRPSHYITIIPPEKEQQ